jgi:hypothetical protein
MIKRILQFGVFTVILSGCGSNNHHPQQTDNNQKSTAHKNNLLANNKSNTINKISGQLLSSDKVSGGVLKILVGHTYSKIVYNNEIIKKGFGPLEVKHIYTAGNSSAILMEDNSNGTACPYKYFFITTSKNGKYTMTKEFGTCGNINSIKPNDGNLLIGLNVVHNQYSAMTAKLAGITYYIYNKGSVTKMANIHFNKNSANDINNHPRPNNPDSRPFKIGFRKEIVKIPFRYELKQIKITSLSNALVLTGLSLNKGNCSYVKRKHEFVNGKFYLSSIFPWPLRYGDNAKIQVFCTPEKVHLFTNEGSYVLFQK